jgi:uroporphyrinogen decarboxylase
MESVKEWFQQLIKKNKNIGMPIATYPGLQITGGRVIDLVTDGKEQARCIQALAERFPSLAGVMVMDLSVEAEAFGSRVHFFDDEVPTITGALVFDLKSINALPVPTVGIARTGEYLKAATLAAKSIRKPVFGGMIGPYSLAGRLHGLSDFMIFVMMEPSTAHLLLQKCIDFLIDYALAYKKTGANGVIIAEPAAGLLSPELCQEFSSDYIKQLVEVVQDDSFAVILHNCGNTVTLVQSMLSTGSMAYHFGNAVDMLDILPQVPSGTVVFGNLDPVGVFSHGNPESVAKETLNLMMRTENYQNFVISSGCDIPPGSPLENLDAFYNVVHVYLST